MNECSHCGGAGNVAGDPCKPCNRTGVQQESESGVDVLSALAQHLSVMLGSATALVDGMGNVVGYQIKTGALHRMLGEMACAGHPVVVPRCRTQLVLNHPASPVVIAEPT